MATNNATDNIPVLPLDVAHSGTGQASLTAHAVLVGNGTTGITQLTVGGNNSIMMGSTGADPAFTTSGTPYATGISFDSGSNTLSNYATGTFTPTVTGGTVAGTTTYLVQNGYYTRIGNIVFCMACIQQTNVGGSGNMVLGGLPFTANSQSNGYFASSVKVSEVGSPSWGAGYTHIDIIVNPGTTTANIQLSGSAKSLTLLQLATTQYTTRYNLAYQI